MMLPAYGGIQEINTLYICASSFLSSGILIGLLAYYHYNKMDDDHQIACDSYSDYCEQEKKIALRNYNEYVRIDVKCPECGAHHTQLPLFSEHKGHYWFFKCENLQCTNTIAISSLDPNTQIVASSLRRST